MTKKPLNSGKPWTPSDLKLLKNEVRSHTPTRMIAMHLKRSVEAIYAKAANMHLSLRMAHLKPAHISRAKW